MAPGANIGDKAAIFEATHGTAPKHAGLNKINPGSVILSGVMMLEYFGWNEAANLITKGISKSIENQKGKLPIVTFPGNIGNNMSLVKTLEILENKKF